MISTITLLGQAGDLIPDHPMFRYVNIETREPFEEQPSFSQVPVMYWDRSAANYFLKIPNNHLVVIFGRLESHPDIGLFVLAEQIRHFPSNLKS